MKSILLYNDNVKRTFSALFEKQQQISPSLAAMLEENFDLDNFLHAELGNILSETFDCIFLTYSLNNEDYLQFTGLLVAMHIRLTTKFKNTNTPIVFVGFDDPEHIIKLNTLGSILFTPGIYKLKDQSEVGKSQIEAAVARKGVISEQSYEHFLSRIEVEPPANYASYHSLANEWGMKRLSDLFKRVDIPQALKQELSVFEHRFATKIYFKYLEAKLGSRKKIKEADRILMTIPNLGPGDIVYIDDEHNKGWSILLRELFKKSHAQLNLIHFSDFDKQDSREALLDKLKVFLKTEEVKKAKLYIVDLRLCDEDMRAQDHLQLTGLKLLDVLREQNQGNQVLIFTASNKSWNVNAATKAGAVAYTLKESPELKYSQKQSQLLFEEFSKGIQKGYNKAYIKDFWQFIKDAREKGRGKDLVVNEFAKKLIEKGGWLDQIFTLLNFGDQVVYKQVLITFINILEAYGDATIEDGDEVVVRCHHDGSRVVIRNSLAQVKFDLLHKKYAFHTKGEEELGTVEFYNDFQRSLRDFKHTGEVSTKAKIVSSLYYNYGFSISRLEEILEFNFLRNNLAAHGGENLVNENLRPLILKDVQKMIGILKEMFS